MRDAAEAEAGSDAMPGEVLREDSGLDWEALRAGGRLYLFCYVRSTVVALALPVVVALSGCVGETGDSICDVAFSKNETWILPSTMACPGCEGETLRDVIDGSGESGGRMVFNADGTAPAGGDYSVDIVQGARHRAGGRVGAYLTFPQGTFSSIAVRFTTYRDGDRQENIDCSSDAGGCESAGGAIDGAGAFTFYGGPTSRAFDQVNMTVTLAGATGPTVVEVHEVCPAQ